MEGKTPKASRSISTPKSTGSSRLAQHGSKRLGAKPTTPMPETSGSGRPSTVTLPQKALERMIRLLKADADPSLILALMGAIPTLLPASEGGQFTITLPREVHVRMIRLLKPEADPALVLALIGADFVPPPAGTIDIPDSNSEHVSMEDIRRVELGEKVEQRPQFASDDGRTNREVIAHPQEQRIEEAGISHAKEGGEELEQPLPITEKDGGNLVESVERVNADSAAQVPEGHKASEEMEQQFFPVEKSLEEPNIQWGEVMDIVRQVTMEVEPSPTAEVPEETQIGSIPMETSVSTGPTGDAEQPLVTPEEVIANLTTRNVEDTDVGTEMEEHRMVEG